MLVARYVKLCRRWEVSFEYYDGDARILERNGDTGCLVVSTFLLKVQALLGDNYQSSGATGCLVASTLYQVQQVLTPSEYYDAQALVLLVAL